MEEEGLGVGVEVEVGRGSRRVEEDTAMGDGKGQSDRGILSFCVPPESASSSSSLPVPIIIISDDRDGVGVEGGVDWGVKTDVGKGEVVGGGGAGGGGGDRQWKGCGGRGERGTHT